jgi:hypothetical protein
MSTPVNIPFIKNSLNTKSEKHEIYLFFFVFSNFRAFVIIYAFGSPLPEDPDSALIARKLLFQHYF